MYVYVAKEKDNVKYFAYFFAFIPALLYIVNVYNNAINIPYDDDFDAVLGFLLEFKVATFGSKLALLFSQHNEHRLLLARLVLVAHYYIFGEVNFRHLILFNAGLALFIFGMCFYFIKKCLPKDWYIPLIVLSLSLFDLNNWENANVSLAGIFNYGIISLFLLSLFLWSLPKKIFIVLAVLVQAMTVFSGGNGIIATFFVVLFTVFNKDVPRAVVCVITFLVTAPLYYFHYQASNALFFTTDLSVVARVLFNALGGNFGIQIGFIAGIIISIVFFILLPINRKLVVKANALPLLALGGFMFTSMLIMSMFRGKLPVEAAYSSRYMIYNHLLYVALCVFFFLNVRSLRLRLSFLLFSSYFYVLNFAAGQASFQANKMTLQTIDYHYPNKEIAKQRSEEACAKGVYCIEKHRKDK